MAPLNSRVPAPATAMKPPEPSYELAMKRARDKLLKNPATGEPYSCWSLSIPISVFARLGEDTATYMTLLQEAFILALAGSALAIYPMYLNARNAPEGLNIWGMTSIGAASRVEWGHVLCDMATTCLWMVYIWRQQRRTLHVDKAGDIARQHSTRSFSLGRSARARWRRMSVVGSPIPRLSRQVHSSGGAARVHAAPPSPPPGELSPGSRCARISANDEVQQAPPCRDGENTGAAPSLPPVEQRGPAARPSSGRCLAEASMSPAPPTYVSSGSSMSGKSVCFASAAHESCGRSHSGGRRSGEDGGSLMPTLKVHGTMRTMANAGEACSVVVWGWEGGEGVPQEAIDAMALVAGAPPWSIQQVTSRRLMCNGRTATHTEAFQPSPCTTHQGDFRSVAVHPPRQ